MAAEVHASSAKEYLVKNQQNKSTGAYQEWKHETG